MTTTTDWIQNFPGLLSLSDEIQNKLNEQSKIIKLNEGQRVFGPGMAPESFILLIEGTIRVQQVSEAGREIVLYRVTAGESCALTTACLMGYEDYLAEAVVEKKQLQSPSPEAFLTTLWPTPLNSGNLSSWHSAFALPTSSGS